MNPYELARDPYVIQPGGGSGVTRPPRMGPTPGGGPDPTFAGVTGGPLQAPPIDPGVDLTTVRPGPVGITPQQQALLDQYMNGRGQSALTRRMAQINAANPLLAQMAGRDGAAQIADAPPALDNAMGRGASTMQTNAGDYAPGPSAGTSNFGGNGPNPGATSGSFNANKQPGMTNSQNMLYGWLDRNAIAGNSGKPSVGPATSAPSPQGQTATRPSIPSQGPGSRLPGSRYF